MTTKDGQMALAECLFAGVACPVVTCCAPCLCCAWQVFACVDDKNRPITRCATEVDSLPCEKFKCVVDNYEIEILGLWQWTCTCGHVFNADRDAKGVAFDCLPLEWPCPECGQTQLSQWTYHADGCHTLSDPPLDFFNFAYEQWRYAQQQRQQPDWYGSPRELSDRRPSASTCSGMPSSGDNSDISWSDKYDVEDCVSIHALDEMPMRIEAHPSTDLADGGSSTALAECCCERGHALTMNNGQLWCPVCVMAIRWPSWPQVPPRECEPLIEPAPMAHRRGLGRETSPVRPGFRAGGGTAGPWWTRTDPRLLR